MQKCATKKRLPAVLSRVYLFDLNHFLVATGQCVVISSFSQLRLGTYHPNKFYANECPQAHFTGLSKYTQEKFQHPGEQGLVKHGDWWTACFPVV